MRIHATTRFKKDVQRCQKRGYPMDRLKAVLDVLETGEALDPKWKNHSLNKTYGGTQECHLLPDWLLIYERDHDDLYLYEPELTPTYLTNTKTAFAVFDCYTLL